MRAYAQYRTFVGTEEDLNKLLFNMQSRDKLLVLSCTRKEEGLDEQNEYEILFQITIDTDQTVTS